MVLGKKVTISIGNGAEIRHLEKGRKSPDSSQTLSLEKEENTDQKYLLTF